MPIAGRIAVHRRKEILLGIAACYRTGHHVRTTALAVHINHEIGVGKLFAMRIELLFYDKLRTRFHGRFRHTLGGINPLDLGRFHFHFRAFFQMHDRHGIHHVFAVAVPRAVMLFHVFELRIFADVEGVFSVVTRGRVHAAAVVNTTSCNNHYIRPFADIEIVVNDFRIPSLGNNHGNMHALIFRAGLDDNVNPFLSVRFRHDIDIRRRVSARLFTVCANVERTLGSSVQVGYLHKQIFLN